MQTQRVKLLAILLATSIPAFAFIVPRLRGHPSLATSRETPREDRARHSLSIRLKAVDQDDLKSLPLPPTKGGFFQQFTESIEHILDPDAATLRRAQELGPVFTMYQFFQPVLVVGGQEAVKEFITQRELTSNVIYAQLPQSFLELHTKWGALNLDANNEIFRQARKLFGEVLSSQEALSYYVKTIEPQIEEYVDGLSKRVESNPEQEFFLVPEISELCLQVFSKLFTGQGLTREQIQMYIDYNSALLSLSTALPSYGKGKEALDSLKAENLRRFRALDDPNLPGDTPGKFYHSKVFGREGFEDEDRVGTGMVLFMWGAYVECASLMVNALALMTKHKIEARDNVLAEYQQRKASGASQSDISFWLAMPYTVGVLRETLRLEAPGAGVPRYGTEEFVLQGYRIPAGLAVMVEPRIGNQDPNLYTEPQQFEPYRWVPRLDEKPATKCPFQGSALKLGPGSWFPGGNGVHKCPGVPLAELVASTFIAKVSERFATWSFTGSGVDENGEIKYVKIPVKIPPDNFGLKFRLANVHATNTNH